MHVPTTVEEVFTHYRSAVLIVDVQHDFCSVGGHFHRYGRDLSEIEAMLPRLRSFLQAVRAQGVPCIFLQQTTLPHGMSDSPAWLFFKTRDGKDPAYTLPRTWGWQFVDGCGPRDGEPVVEKFRSSGFVNTHLETVLRANGIEALVVCGVETDGCVESTLRDGAFRDFFVCLVEDCCASAKRGMHDHALAVIRAHHPVATGDEILSWWRAGQ